MAKQNNQTKRKGADTTDSTTSRHHESDNALANPPDDYVDASTRAAGIAGEANTGGGYGPTAERAPDDQPQPAEQTGRDTGASRGEADTPGVRLGIGLGGVRDVGGGSLGDRDLSGRHGDERAALEDIVDTGETSVGPGSDVGGSGAVPVSEGRRGGNTGAGSTGYGRGGDVDIADLGREAGVIDTTRDPIGGTGDENDGMDESTEMVEGEVGAQAERDLTELLGQHTRPRDPDDARLQQALTELIEEDEDS
jgi:hypothetical protein